MRRSTHAAVAVLLLAVTLAPAAGAAAAAGGPTPRASSLFTAPDALAVVGADLFVANRTANSVTEVATAS